jgi:predicted CXXCH cytochrome family protein
MKSKLIIAALAIAGMGISAIAGIEGSAHDFKDDSWSGGEICVVCHTPHGASVSLSGPLWNRGATTNATFTMYTNPNTLNADMTGQPGAQSLACLSCHDGSVALDSFGGSTTGDTYIASSHNVGGGGSLANEHPIGFTYDSDLATADGSLHDPALTASNIVATLLFGEKVECASCHDVHNDLEYASLLRVDNAGSGLCLTCHDK